MIMKDDSDQWIENLTPGDFYYDLLTEEIGQCVYHPTERESLGFIFPSETYFVIFVGPFHSGEFSTKDNPGEYDTRRLCRLNGAEVLHHYTTKTLFAKGPIKNITLRVSTFFSCFYTYNRTSNVDPVMRLKYKETAK